MDQEMLRALMDEAAGPSTPITTARPDGPGATSAPGLDATVLDDLMSDLSPTAVAPEAGAPLPGAPQTDPQPIGPKPALEPGLGNPTSFLDAMVGGAAQAVFETGDFLSGLFGSGSGPKSEARQNVERGVKRLSQESVVDGFVASLSQFATGMVGLGKLQKGAQAVGWVGSAANAGAKTRAAVEIGKAATVGAVAFDPHAERLSDLVERFPALSNPVSRYLAADPKDSAAEGRLKNAMESIGLDLAVIGVFMAGAKAVRAFKSGDAKAIEAATEELDAAVRVQEAPKPEPSFAPKTPPANHNVGPTPAANDAPLISPESPSAVPAGAEFKPETGAKPEGRPANDTYYDGQAPANSNGSEGDGLMWAVPGGVKEPRAPLPADPVAPQGRAETAWTGQKDPGAVPQAANDVDPQAVTVSAAESTRPAGVSGTAGTAPQGRTVAVTDDQLTAILSGARADANALATHGSWEAAVTNGHVFGKGGSIPWQKLTEAGEPANTVDALVARVAETMAPELAAAKGGDVLTDAQVTRMLDQRARLWGEDPATLMGVLQQAGEGARTMAANMEASFLVAQRSMQDAYAMAARIRAGYLDEFGGDPELASRTLKDMVGVATTAFGNAQAMRSAAGRSLRRLRGEFRLSQADVDALQGLDGDQLAKLLATTEGDPRALAKVLHPSMWARGTDALQWLYVNNLLWGLKTHAINLLTNTYMVVGRPMERVVGSIAVGGETGARIRAESTRQYAYMGASLVDSWRMAVETWRMGDSILHPHSTEVHNLGGSLGKAVAQLPFKPWDSLQNVLHNAVAVAIPKTLGTPTRALGVMDEMVKQVVYRSRVMANAHVEGQAAGLDGVNLSAFVRDRLYGAFDDAGRAVDVAALREAQVATFQQDLLPQTIGRSVQGFAATHQWARFVVPFVRTPTNVIRTGVKMTPGLNLLQREYRDMIRGGMGPEAQAQAVGQMAVGSLFLGTAAYLASTGYITGGGPSDRRLRATLMATGWRPYSFVIPNADGTRTYVEYGRMDPVGIPFGVVADLVDVLSQADEADGVWDRAEASLTGLAVAVSKQLSNKTYLMGVSQAMEGVMDPDRNAGRVIGQMASNLIPMASALRFANPDPYLRDARGITDRLLATIPGLSETVPARYDVWGDPITVHKGFWVDGDRGVVDAELRRMIEEAGVAVGPPSPNIDGVDLREVELKDGRNAYEVYQQLAGKPTPRTRSLKDTVAALMRTPAYGRAPDGDATTRGTKLYTIAGTIARYRAVALRQIKADPNVRQALMAKDQELRAAYAAQRKDPAPAQSNQPREQLNAIGQSFGVDLGGLLK